MNFFKVATALICILSTNQSFAQNAPTAKNLPPPGYIERFIQEKKNPLPIIEKYSSSQLLINKQIEIPDDTKNVRFVLQKLTIEGVDRFKFEEIEPFYKDYMGKEVSLYNMWQIAEKITKHYQDSGYFISRASVIGGEISSRGIFKIKVVEGYVGELSLDDKAMKIPTIVNLVKKLKSEKPLNIKTLERTLLLINDLPSYSFQSVIEPLINANEGAIKLSIISEKKKGSGRIAFNNYNPEFVGTYQIDTSYEKSFTDLSKTSFSYTTSTPINYLQFFNINHDITATPTIIAGLYVGRAKMELGSTLKKFEITSAATNFGVSVTKKIIRQRQNNFSIKFNLDNTNIRSEILSSTLARENIREAKLSFLYDGSDPLKGYNYLDATITRGLSFFGASKRDDRNLSRVDVDPNYNKIELRATRFQNFGNSWSTTLSSQIQLASGPLYSSGRIGYGGQSFGKSFDSSQITGDNGIIAGAEVRYLSISKFYLPILKRTSFIPYVYYDIGRLWNVGEGPQTLSSIGEGFRIESTFGVGANFLIANPIEDRGSYASYYDHNDPRYLFEVYYKF
jgi:hemolysin activation/secretion protein